MTKDQARPLLAEQAIPLPPKGPNRAVGIALLLVEKVAEWQPIGASDIARRLDLPKATVHRLLLALETFGWLERDLENRPLWSVSMRPIAVGGRAIERINGLRMAALSVMDILRHTTGETVHLGLVDGDHISLIERIDGLKSVNVFLPVGTSWALNWSSSGKAVLAHMSETEQARYLSTPRLHRKSETDIIPSAQLAEELEHIRERGYAMSVGLPPSATSSIGTAIFDKAGRPFAGISITGAADRLGEQELIALAPHLMSAARSISMGMNMD
ncbi:MAG TPA: IclR family transcriptional regulator [Sphingopyxis sp.]|nr:IclR family transcriptional regulator [Sphingopyxis sp.]